MWHFMISISVCHTVQITPPSQRENIAAKRREFRESFRQKKILQVHSSLLMDPELPEYQVKIYVYVVTCIDSNTYFYFY